MTDKEYLKDIRKKLHMTQKEMAELLGYKNRPAITAIENGTRQLSGQARAHLRTIEANLEHIKKWLRN